MDVLCMKLYFVFIAVTIQFCDISGYFQSAPSIGHVCQDGCHVCLETEYNPQTIIPVVKHGVCTNTGHKLHNGDLVCLYGYPIRTTMYLLNENITTADTCNTCLCTKNGAICTKVTCGDKVFEKPSSTPIYGDCNDHDRWYRYGALWEADDGCNTCTCVGIGNYQGPFICTQGICNTKLPGPVG